MTHIETKVKVANFYYQLCVLSSIYNTQNYFRDKIKVSLPENNSSISHVIILTMSFLPWLRFFRNVLLLLRCSFHHRRLSVYVAAVYWKRRRRLLCCNYFGSSVKPSKRHWTLWINTTVYVPDVWINELTETWKVWLATVLRHFCYCLYLRFPRISFVSFFSKLPFFDIASSPLHRNLFQDSEW